MVRVIVDVVYADRGLCPRYQSAVGAVDKNAHDVVVIAAYILRVFFAGEEIPNVEGVTGRNNFCPIRGCIERGQTSNEFGQCGVTRGSQIAGCLLSRCSHRVLHVAC
ncbi:hypothetical protein D3C85_1650790 [compost metagenome]